MSVLAYLAKRRPWESALYPDTPPSTSYTSPEKYDPVLRHLLGMAPAPDPSEVAPGDAAPPLSYPENK